VVCCRGEKLAQGTAAWLRQLDVEPETLEGGFEGWKEAKLPLDATQTAAARRQGTHGLGDAGAAEVDRIACPWLIAAFVDPNACSCSWRRRGGRGRRALQRRPFDIENVFWSHRGDTCTFDEMIEEFGLARRRCCGWRRIVRGADTARLDLSPEGARAARGLARAVADV
jgi:hypothetical protein